MRQIQKNTGNAAAASRLKNNDGFTILEVVFSMGIFDALIKQMPKGRYDDIIRPLGTLADKL